MNYMNLLNPTSVEQLWAAARFSDCSDWSWWMSNTWGRSPVGATREDLARASSSSSLRSQTVSASASEVQASCGCRKRPKTHWSNTVAYDAKHATNCPLSLSSPNHDSPRSPSCCRSHSALLRTLLNVGSLQDEDLLPGAQSSLGYICYMMYDICAYHILSLPSSSSAICNFSCQSLAHRFAFKCLSSSDHLKTQFQLLVLTCHTCSGWLTCDTAAFSKAYQHVLTSADHNG